MDGFLNVDKPAGITSYDVIRALKKQLRSVKMGHLGTLDPMATGVLPVAVGRATRLIPLLEETDKAYVARARFGGTSDTEDAWGNIVWRHEPFNITEKDLREVLTLFTGEILQVPPMYSAVHHQGKRLYELAREGKSAEVPPRQVKIKRLELTDWGRDESGWWADLFIECSRGTYIRTLVKDIGEKLGCGAFMGSLRRLKSGPFRIEDAVPLEDVVAQRDLLPPDYPFSSWPVIQLDASQARQVLNGNRIPYEVPDSLPLSQVRIADQEGRLLALGSVERADNNTRLKAIRIIGGND